MTSTMRRRISPMTTWPIWAQGITIVIATYAALGLIWGLYAATGRGRPLTYLIVYPPVFGIGWTVTQYAAARRRRQ